MPELPEVELVARSLDRLVSGRRIENAYLLRAKLAPDTTQKRFSEQISGSRINFVHRRGKHVLVDLNNGLTLISHLRMSGRFLLLSGDREDPKFTHAAFYFEDESRLVFQDQRHFGMMKLVKTRELPTTRELATLAPEPLSDEFDFDYLRSRLRSSQRSLKEFLLDQSKVCGLGNIYAAEALFLAGVHPAARPNRLSRVRTQMLLEKIREVLSEAINAGSTLNVDPENIDGSYYGGGFESKWRVYDREGMPCPLCTSYIVRLKQSGRSSYFCPKCQRK